MSYAASAIFSLGASQIGLSELTVQPLTAAGAATGGLVVGTWTEQGSGVYAWSGTVPDDALRGRAYRTDDESILSVRQFASVLTAAYDPAKTPAPTTAQMTGAITSLPAWATWHTATQQTQDVMQTTGLVGDAITAIGTRASQASVTTLTTSVGSIHFLDAAGIRAALGMGTANLDVQLAGIAGVPGSGDVPVNHNTGGADRLRFRDAANNGIDGATVLAYRESEYAAGGRVVRDVSTTGTDGRWLSDMMLDPGEYRFRFVRAGYISIDSVVVVPAA